MAILCGVLFKNKDYYSNCTQALNQKDFLLKELVPFGLYVLDKYSYSFNTNYDRKILNSISEVYGQEYSAFYIRIFHANKIVLIALCIICELIVGILTEFQGVFLLYVLIIFGVLVISDDIKGRGHSYKI
jgi:tight adherence protein C